MAHPHRIFLVRHGETEWSKSGQHTGRTDIPLTPTGERQGQALARHLAGHTFAQVLTSPLSRARETCRLAGFDGVAEVSDDLREWNYGIYEGVTTASVREQQPGWTIWTSPVPEGETVDQVGERARRVIERVDAMKGDVALFAHAHFLRILGACWMGLAPIHGRHLTLGTASISVLGYERETRVVQVWNQDWRLGVEIRE
ncbi:MAG: histidine phosphatase family protein [Candidatus Rokubacteria bacterium]|nr:histidine phosphatase family protein [Candidatus Rokubacteria bacterium]